MYYLALHIIAYINNINIENKNLRNEINHEDEKKKY